LIADRQPVVQEIRERLKREHGSSGRLVKTGEVRRALLVRVAEEEEAAILGSEDSEADDAPAEGST